MYETLFSRTAYYIVNKVTLQSLLLICKCKSLDFSTLTMAILIVNGYRNSLSIEKRYFEHQYNYKAKAINRCLIEVSVYLVRRLVNRIF